MNDQFMSWKMDNPNVRLQSIQLEIRAISFASFRLSFSYSVSPCDTFVMVMARW
jgi:hypothetical protein